MTEKFEEMVIRIADPLRLKQYGTAGLLDFARRLHDELLLEDEPVAWICPRSLESVRGAKDSPGGLSYLTLQPEPDDVPLYLHPAPKVPEGRVSIPISRHKEIFDRLEAMVAEHRSMLAEAQKENDK